MAQKDIFEFLEVENIKNDAILLKDGSLRGVLMVSAMNFPLKSAEEQEAIIMQFQNFLNSLDFSIQILVLSRRLNITPYIDKIKELEEKQTNELLKIQTRDYRKFIENMVKTGVIMSKIFLVFVPHYPLRLGKEKKEFSEEEFEREKTQLKEKMEFVGLGLKRCGMEVTPLKSLELIDLFWSFFHQEEAEKGYYPEIPPEFLK